MGTAFVAALSRTLGFEGGYSDDPDDPGGETYCGVSRRNWPEWPRWATVDRVTATAPNAAQRNAALASDPALREAVAQFYRDQFWTPLQADPWTNPALAADVFDAAVNCGLGEAVKLLQSAVGLPPAACDGQMLILTDSNLNLRAVDWADCEDRLHRLLRTHYGDSGFRIGARRIASKATEALEQYFQGVPEAIDTLGVETGGTAFQRVVWRALRNIACGTTTTYAALAKQIGCPAAVRAVGAANASNPVGVVVPCHRVIGSDGSLTGYAGGMERKQWLLAHERKALKSRWPE
ncbi:MAG: methylated-DNA--[protein]-cysteine S-methyltransferase [Terriglobales bacterium]